MEGKKADLLPLKMYLFTLRFHFENQAVFCMSKWSKFFTKELIPLENGALNLKRKFYFPWKCIYSPSVFSLKIQLTFVCPELRCGYVFNLLPSKKYVFVSSSLLQWNMKSFYNGSTLKERVCSKKILWTKNHSEWSKNQKKQSSFTCSSKLTEAGRVAQSVGHLTPKSGVLGSIPGLATYFRFPFRFFKKGSCQLLAKVCAWSTG